MNPTRFLFEIVLLAAVTYFWFRPGPARRRKRFRRRIRQWLRILTLKRILWIGVIVFLLMPHGLGRFVPILRDVPSLLEGQKLRLIYGPVAFLVQSLGLEGSVRDGIRSQSKIHGVESALVRAVVQTESSGRQFVVSSSGAMGLMQLKPSTFFSLRGGNPFGAENNIAAGTEYLGQLIDRFKGSYRLAVAAYNAGPGVVGRCHCVPNNGKTPAYVARVSSWYRKYNGQKRF